MEINLVASVLEKILAHTAQIRSLAQVMFSEICDGRTMVLEAGKRAGLGQVFAAGWLVVAELH
jgi:hypothetical protein